MPRGRADGRPAHGPPSLIEVRGSKHPDVRRRRALGALLGVVTHFRAVGQRLEAAALDRVVMHEQVLAGLIWGDEPVALVVADPLHRSCCQLIHLRGMCTARRGGCLKATTAERGALLRSNGCPTRRTRVAPPPPADLL